jgi:hypothetical protein
MQPPCVNVRLHTCRAFVLALLFSSCSRLPQCCRCSVFAVPWSNALRLPINALRLDAGGSHVWAQPGVRLCS